MDQSQIFKHRPLIQPLARWLLRFFGWQTEMNLPTTRKFVLVVAPHTSNWDFPLGLCVALAHDLLPQWVGKAELFRPPFGGLMRWLGGVALDRSKSHDFVGQVVDLYKTQDEFVIAITPEGTRRRTQYWRTGFYYIALGANVPIAVGYLDYKRKIAGINHAFLPTGDIQADFAHLRHFYSQVTGKYPAQQGEIQARLTTPPTSSHRDA